jgi:uncharacterized membrane protein HdeD (DUF308 family)
MVIATITISGIVALIAGILILAWPKTLNIVVGVWLVINGLLQIFG